MGRPKLFSESQVLSAAMDEFWKRGYSGASTADLCRATQLKPGSIYHQFGDKKGLFLQALNFYHENIVSQRVNDMLGQDDPLDGIEYFFSSAYEGVQAKCLLGCLITNTAPDQCVEDSCIKNILNQGIRTMERAFESRVRDAVAVGDLPVQTDAKEAAVYLVSCFQGLMVVSRLTRNKARLRTITKQTMIMLHQSNNLRQS